MDGPLLKRQKLLELVKDVLGRHPARAQSPQGPSREPPVRETQGQYIGS